MADIKLSSNGILLEGAEVQNTGELAGYSFHDRHNPAQRWVLYSDGGTARLWDQSTGKDHLVVDPTGAVFIKGTASVDGTIQANDIVGSGQITSRGQQAGLLFLDQTPNFLEGLNKGWTWSAQSGTARLWSREGGKNVITASPSGNVTVAGTLSQASSAAFKENVEELGAEEALATLDGLNPVKFTYVDDSDHLQNVGFLAEDVPELMTNPDRDRIAPMDVIGVLTRALQEQQKQLAALRAEISTLRNDRTGSR